MHCEAQADVCEGQAEEKKAVRRPGDGGEADEAEGQAEKKKAVRRPDR